jgi:hypothetical protein
MILAKINQDGIVLDTIVASLSDVLPEGNWVECPAWIGIGMHIDEPDPNAEQEENNSEVQ